MVPYFDEMVPYFIEPGTSDFGETVSYFVEMGPFVETGAYLRLKISKISIKVPAKIPGHFCESRPPGLTVDP